MTLKIRKERGGDEKAISDVNFRAFGREAEPKNVDLLRKNCPQGVSLVAEREEAVVGHIPFTPALIEDGGVQTAGMGLGPLAVAPECQRQGIGSALVRAGLEAVRGAGTLFVVVIGHPGFCPRFGFGKGSVYGLRSEYDQVSDEAFMIIAFDPEKFRGARGVVRQRPEFAYAV
jgi:putative acetyltransferase